MIEPSSETTRRAAGVRLVLLDSDGVWTDGRLYLDAGGGELRAFHVRDGLGIRLGQRAGLRFGIVSGRESTVVSLRAGELGIEEVHQRIGDKLACCEEILERQRIGFDAVCFVGDDLVDLPVMRRAGLAAAPADAGPEAKSAAHLVTRARGGRGAVREVIDFILRASGQWDQVTEPYFK